MYSEKELRIMGYNNDEIEIIMKNKIDKKISEEIINALLQNDISIKKSYTKFITKMEEILLNTIVNIYGNYGYPYEFGYNKFQFKDFVNVKKMNKIEFNKEFSLCYKEFWQPYHGDYTEKALLFLANDKYISNEDYRDLWHFNSGNLLSYFGIKFKGEKDYYYEYPDSYGEVYRKEKELFNPIKNNKEPLLILQIHRCYQDGEPGYNCYELKYNLIIIE